MISKGDLIRRLCVATRNGSIQWIIDNNEYISSIDRYSIKIVSCHLEYISPAIIFIDADESVDNQVILDITKEQFAIFYEAFLEVYMKKENEIIDKKMIYANRIIDCMVKPS